MSLTGSVELPLPVSQIVMSQIVPCVNSALEFIPKLALEYQKLPKFACSKAEETFPCLLGSSELLPVLASSSVKLRTDAQQSNHRLLEAL